MTGNDLGNWATDSIARMMVLAFLAGVFVGVCLMVFVGTVLP